MLVSRLLVLQRLEVAFTVWKLDESGTCLLAEPRVPKQTLSALALRGRFLRHCGVNFYASKWPASHLDFRLIFYKY
jgi:hypothetical protein